MTVDKLPISQWMLLLLNYSVRVIRYDDVSGLPSNGACCYHLKCLLENDKFDLGMLML